MRLLLSFTIIASSLFCQAQSNQAEYLEAKRQFSLGNYAASKLGFQKLSDDKAFGSYASFYFALASYKNGEKQLAYDMWKQVDSKYPDWEEKEEVNYWLTRLSFELNRHAQGFRYLRELPDDLQELTFQETIDSLSIAVIRAAYLSNTSDETIGLVLARKIMRLPYGERDKALLNELRGKFSIPLEQSNLGEIKKDAYGVAVVLPFMFESIETPQTVIRNAIIWNLYEGMELAQKDLKKEAINIELFPFDTKKSKEVTGKLVDEGVLDNADVIIGPLLSGPNEVITAFSSTNKVTMINPLSSNGEQVKDNFYSYLFKPSYATQGKVAGSYAVEQFQENKKALVFFETDRDSIVAKNYLDEIEKDGFFVIRFERLTGEGAQQVQRDFSDKYEVRLDDQYSKQEIDSIGDIPGRIVQTRPLREARTGKIITDDEGDPVLEYYEERFTVVEDSIGHIFVASSSNLIANNFISLSEVRNDSIGIIGYDDWLNFSTITYTQLERLEIAFLSPSLFNKQTEFYKKLEDRFIQDLGREPGEYHLIGYELVHQLGQLLNQNGKYFQKGLSSDQTIEGKVMYGLKYGSFHDNQIVPITKLKDLKLINQNTVSEEN